MVHRTVWLLSGLALASVGMVGCRTAAEKRYQVAERMFAQGKLDLAAAEYERMVDDHPRDPLCADAHYKLAYLKRTHGDDPDGAAECYLKLASEYGSSRYADDALLWVAWIGRSQGDIERVRGAINRLEAEHADQPAVCARARVQLALGLLEAESPDAKVAAELILKRYPSQPRQCAQAQLILARAIQRIDGDATKALEQYEQVIKLYPDSMSAVEAQREIGWHAYMTPPTPEPEAPPPKTKLVKGVAPFAQGPQPGMRTLTLEALRSLVKHGGTDADISTLMALSGAAFQFVYSPTNRSMGAAVFATRPFETVADSYGYLHRQDASSSPDEAIVGLCQALDRDRPVIVPYAGRGWVIVVGYDEGKKQVIFLQAGAASQRSATYAAFAGEWKKACDQWGQAMPPFFQFSLGLQQSKPTAADLVRAAASRGVYLWERTNVLDAPAGAAAYEALAADLEAHASDFVPDDTEDLASWAGEPLSVLRDGRRAAAQFLRAKAPALAPEHQAQAVAAADAYGALDAKLAALATSFPKPAPGGEPGTVSPEYSGAALASARLVREALELDRLATDHLAALASE